jgi:hypothetical protein
MNISKMEFRKPGGVSRRDVLAALLAGTALVGVWSTPAAAAALQAAGASPAAGAGLTQAEMAVLSLAADVILPATDTPGAREAGVPQFVGAMVAHWMNPAEAAQFRAGLAALDASAQQRFQRGYAECTPEQGAEVMQALRASSPYSGRTFSLTDRILDAKAPFYLRLRDLVVLGYFTSEAGSTRELRYLPVPGKFEANLDIKSWPYQTVI